MMKLRLLAACLAAPLLLSAQPLAAAPDAPASPAVPPRSAAAQAVLDAFAKNDPATAFQAATEGRAKGDSACIYLLGQMHELGRGAPAQDLKQAFLLFEEAAKAGVPEAMTAVARGLDQGRGVDKNPEKAMFYWQMAAEAGDPPALGKMGEAELEGHLRPANEEVALAWLEKAAAAKDPLGLWLLSRFYDAGRAGLTANAEKALSLCSEAAQAGEIPAMHRMGEYYAIGRGRPRDPVAANGWFRLAADHGHIPSLAQLAAAYYSGTGCLVNKQLALELAAVAAQAGHPRSQLLVGRILDGGLGGRRMPQVALAYYLRASANGVSEARAAAERLKSALKPEEAQQGEALAADKNFHFDPSKSHPEK